MKKAMRAIGFLLDGACFYLGCLNAWVALDAHSLLHGLLAVLMFACVGINLRSARAWR